MGCAGSKIDDLEAVALCRERSRLLDEAIGCRYAHADAHAAYSTSLRSFGESLHRFLEAIQNLPPPRSPRLTLPAQRKGEDLTQPAVLAAADDAHSGSGSHIHFHSDSEDLETDEDEEDDEFPLHSDGDSPIHHHLHEESSPPGPATINHSKNQPPNRSVSYEQRPKSPETVHFGGGEASSSAYHPYYDYSYPQQNPGFHPYPNYGYPSNYGEYGEMGGHFGSSSPPAGMPPAGMGLGPGSPGSKAAPPPPSPPRVSTWDFLNPFESYESYFAPYTPSRNSKDVREEEGIPDLEDEESEVVKQAYDDKKKVMNSGGSSPDSSNGDKISEAGEEPPSQLKKRSLDAGTSEANAASVVVDKNVVADEVKEPDQQKNVAAFPLKRYHGLPEVAQEIKLQFDRASESAIELSNMLEVGKQPYHQRNSVYKVSSRMICGANPLSSSKEEFMVFEGDKSMGSGNLSSTLQKLYIWEKKLYDEVRAEEKLRVLHDRKCCEMKRLDERGAEAHKLDSTLATVRKLSTKIRIAIQVVDSISNKISMLRDDELWPQISELIQGLMRMWSVMLECHRIQCQALSEAEILDSFASGGKISDAHMEIMKQLALELLEWVASFSAWIYTQKSYVKTLNDWLVKGLRYVPEETPDGYAPFSPGRLGAPPVFVICNQWAQTMERISEKEVIDAMQAFASNVLHLWEKHNFEQRQRLMANKDMDRTLRIMEREEQEIRRAVEAQNRKLVPYSGQRLTLFEHTEEASNLLGGLRQIFEAMENFSATTLKAYEELHIHAEEERSARENEKVT